MKREAPTSMRNHPERALRTTLGALHRGYSLGRPMTIRERLVIALLAVTPGYHLTLHSPSEALIASWWPSYLKRINRARRPRPQLIYFGVQAQGLGRGGHHLHLLVWEWLPVWILHRHAREIGIGEPHIDRLPDPQSDLLGCATMVAYVVGQHEPVFGTRHHERHESPRSYQRPWIRPHRRTLDRHHPELLSAFDQAKSPSVSDKDLVSRMPTFSNNSATENGNQ